MQIRFQLHGVLIRLAGTETATLECPPGATVNRALDQLTQQFPALATELNRTACAIGEALVSRDTVLEGNTEIALIPPVSGG